MDAAIVARGLTKRFGAAMALDGLDLDVARGEVFGFVGPNGAGKTTTIRLLLDLLRPTSGTLSVLGLDPRRDGPQLRRHVGYLPGDLNLPPRLTGRQLLHDHAAVRGLVLDGQVDAMAERLSADLDRPMGELSMGNRRKIGVIDAFVHRPDLLVLDEPTGGLDPLVQQEFRLLVREVADEGRTVFLSSHVLDEVQHTAHRVAVVRRGKVVVVDRVDALITRPMRTVTVAFAAPPPADAFVAVAGVVSTEPVAPNGVRFVLDGPAGALLSAIAPFSPLDLHATEPDLEDAFLGYYEGDGR